MILKSTSTIQTKIGPDIMVAAWDSYSWVKV